jgi:hypothetical protein
MEWVTPTKLVDSLKTSGSQPTQILEAICRRASRGLLEARADRLVEQGIDIEGNRIPTDLWGHGYAALKGSAWSLGDLVFTIPQDTRGYRFKRFEAFGVTFSRADAEKMGAVFDPMPSQPLGQKSLEAVSAAGNKLDTEVWSQFAAALAYVANTDGLETFRSRDSVYNRVADYLARRSITAGNEKNYRNMIRLARTWIEEGEDTDK